MNTALFICSRCLLDRKSASLSLLLSGLLCAFSANRLAFGALGEDPKKCGERYGDLIESRPDWINKQNEIRTYRSPRMQADVIFNNKKIAVEVIYSAKELTDTQVSDLLSLNSAGWKRQKDPDPKLGTASDHIKLTTWVTPDGKFAMLGRDSEKGDRLHITTPERINDTADQMRTLWNKQRKPVE